MMALLQNFEQLSQPPLPCISPLIHDSIEINHDRPSQFPNCPSDCLQSALPYCLAALSPIAIRNSFRTSRTTLTAFPYSSSDTCSSGRWSSAESPGPYATAGQPHAG